MAGYGDGQPHPSGSRSQLDGSPWRDMPQPLHITKRSDLRRGNQIVWGSRRCSPESDGSSASMDSPLEPPGGRPLTLPKRRGDRGGWVTYPVGCTRDKDKGRGITDDTAAALLADAAALQHRRSASCASSRQSKGLVSYGPGPSNRINDSLLRPGRSQIPRGIVNPESPREDGGSTLAAAADGEWGEVSPPRGAKSMFHRPPSYNLEDDARTMHTSVLSEFERLTNDPPLPSLPVPLVLTPRITVIPESRAVDQGVVAVWAAVQLSAQVCRADAPEQHQQQYDPAIGGQPAVDAFRYGFLYDVSVEILPTPKSTIVELLDDKACAKILHQGSGLLFVAHVRLEPAISHRRRTHVRQNSDDLIEDLEHQLGGAVTEYVQVRVTYRHSGFLQRHMQTAATVKTTAPDGVISLQTRLQTTAVAAIQRRNSASPWSPPPCMPRPNPLFETIASHWGADNAHAVMQRVIRSRSIPPPTDGANPPPSRPPVLRPTPSPYSAKGIREQNKRRFSQPNQNPTPPSPPQPAPHIPRRQTSLHHMPAPSPAPTHQHQHHPNHDTTPPGTVARRKPRRPSRARHIASVFQASSSSFSSSSSSSPPLSFMTPTASRSRHSPGMVVRSSTSITSRAGARAEAEAEREQQGQLRGRLFAGGEVAPVAVSPAVGDVVVGAGSTSTGGSVRERKGKERERGSGWGWAGWW